MIIVLAGNIASGKSTVARYIQSYAPAFQLVGIDEYRAEGRSEEQARLMLLGAFGQHEHIIYETTTANKTHEAIMAHLVTSGQSYIKVRLGASPEICRIRAEARGQTTYFHWAHLEIHDSIAFIGDHLRCFHADLYYDTTQKHPVEIALAILKAIGHEPKVQELMEKIVF